jgi:glucose/arabinose dehydrogenase
MKPLRFLPGAPSTVEVDAPMPCSSLPVLAACPPLNRTRVERSPRRRATAGLAFGLLLGGLLAIALVALPGSNATAGVLPPGFIETPIGGTWNEAVGLQFTSAGRIFVWERGGRVWTVTGGVKSATPFLDLSQEVGAWRDLGLLGFALHPNFVNNGYVYLYYAVDRHHLLNFGTPAYNPNTNQYFAASQGRITRYTAQRPPGDTDYRNAVVADPASRFVLHGENPGEGCPLLFESHGPGQLVFGDDNTLLAACGDGASFAGTDTGSFPNTYFAQAIADGIIRPAENVGAFRAQMLSSLSGKILRLDPLTGQGLPSNPFYDGNLDSTRSKVWALGMRNPYRMVLVPESGDHDPTEGRPGILYVGDVGYTRIEDLHVADGPGQNFGWPIYEGLDDQDEYVVATTQNPDAPNPLHNGTTCNLPFLRFIDLFRNATLDPAARHPNPCNPAVDIPPGTPTFFHERPRLDYRHGATGGARWGSFNGFNPITVPVGTAQDPQGKSVPGPLFGGNTSTAGFVYTGTSFPPAYHGKYFHADWEEHWIKVIDMDANHDPVSISDFLSDGGGVVFATMDPTNGDVYYISWTTQVLRVRYIGSGNAPPTARATATPVFGSAPLSVSFNADASSDPEETALAYLWTFGDGTTSTLRNPTKIYPANGGALQTRTVTLQVTDAGSPAQSDTDTLTIWLNNLPPEVTLTSPIDGSLYTLVAPTMLSLSAIYSDPETPLAGLSCEWLVTLHHNDHSHTDPPIQTCSATTEIAPLGCDPNATYRWQIDLTVTDAQGLSTRRTATVFPNETNCSGTNQPPIAGNDSATAARGVPLAIDLLDNDTDADGTIQPNSVSIVTGPTSGSITSIDPQTGIVTFLAPAAGPSTSVFAYTVVDDDGMLSNTASVVVTIGGVAQVPSLRPGALLGLVTALFGAGAIALGVRSRRPRGA